MFKIRGVQSSDYAEWLPLWQANNDGKDKPAVTKETWVRLMDSGSPVNGLVAVRADKIAGLLHYVLHPTTGSIEPICYMQDLYVAPTHRRHGAAKALVLELVKIGNKAGWNRLYWLAEKKNVAAQNLYKTLGLPLDFSLHVWPLGMLKK